jgi:hypothetical protein
MITLLLKQVLRQERPITFELPELRTAADVENSNAQFAVLFGERFTRAMA